MRSIIALGLISASMALSATGCANGGDSESELVGQAEQALTSGYFWDGPALFRAFTLYQNCNLTIETTDATSQRDSVLALIINNGSPSPWGSATVPCNHGTPAATDGFSTLAFSNNVSSTNYNAKVSWMNPNGGAGVTVFAVGFLDATNQGTAAYFGNLTVKYSIAGCNDTSKNRPSTTFIQNFQGSGIQGAFQNFAFTWQPRPGGPQCATDTVLFGIDPTAYGPGRCNDDCANPLDGMTPTLSCISNNTGSSLWWMSPGWHWNGSGSGFTSVNAQ